MSVIGSNILAGASGGAGAAGFQIDRSLRFNDDDSAYLNRTPSSAGNRRTWTWSGWVKRSKLGVLQQIFGAGQQSTNDGIYTYFRIDSNDKLNYRQWTDSVALDAQLTSTAVFRDTSAWFHLVFAYDSTQSTDADKVKIYINGSQLEDFDSNDYPGLNSQAQINNTKLHTICSQNDGGTQYNHFDGYLADVHFIDGQALAPTDFGEYDDNNVWQPKEVSVTSPNDGTTWSNSCSGTIYNASLGYANAFDGSLTTYSHAANGNTITFTPSSAIPVSSSVRIFCTLGSITGSTGTADVTVNGTSYVATANTNRSDGYFTVTGITSITSITWERAADNDLVAVSAIEVDGEILIDGYNNSTGYGTNGFHLDFSDNSSNAALGTDSSGNSNTWTVNNLSVAADPLSSSRGTNYDDDSATYTEYGTVSQATGQTLPMSNPSHYEGAAMRVNSGGFKVVTTNSATTDFFMACWVKLDSLVNGHQIGVDIQGSYKYFEVRSDGSVLVRHTGGAASQSSASTLSSNTWMHIALSRSGSTLRAFVDGTIVCSTTDGVTGDSISANEEFNFFGQSGTLYNTTGYLLDPVVYIGEGRSTNYTAPTAPLLTSAGAINDVAGMSSSNRYYASPLISVGGGAEVIDSLIDTPTNYEAASGNNGGNYATLNPLESALTGLNNGNLNSGSSGAASWKICTSTLAVSSGKYYWEGFADTTATASIGWQWGFCNVTPSSLTTPYGTGKWSYQNDSVYTESSSGSTVGTSAGANDLLAYALDMDAGTCKLYVNNSLVHTFTGITGTVTPFVGSYNSATMTVNFGQRPFAYTPPSNHKSLCTQNLTDPTIADGSTAFDAVLYTGDGSSTQTITGLSFAPDLTWQKIRNTTGVHGLTDSVRGVSAGYLRSDSTNAETGNATNGVSAFTSDGFTAAGAFNTSSNNWVTWTWDGGTVSYPVGDIWQGSATKYIGVKFATASGGTVSYGQTTGTTTVEVWTSSDNSNWTQQGGTLTLSDGHTLTTSDQYVFIRNTSDATFTDWYAAATNGADGHYSSVTYPSGASWTGPAYTDFDWREDGGVVNTDGSILSTVRANQSAGFSIVSWTAASNTTNSIGHGLNAAPKLIIAKSRSNTNNWRVYTATTGKDKYLGLNETSAAASYSNFWSTSEPTSSTFGVWNATGAANNDGDMVAYCFAPVEGFSAFGSYTASSALPFIYTGFEVAFLMIKNISSASTNWRIMDSTRDTFNDGSGAKWLKANTSGAEVDERPVDLLSNGFKMRMTDGGDLNYSSDTFIYAAFAEHPFKTARAR